MKCEDCKYFRETPTLVIPGLKWTDDVQHCNVIEMSHEGLCEHEYNWKPSRGDMPVDKDFRCDKFEKQE